MILISGSNGLLGTSLKYYLKKKKIDFKTMGSENSNFNGDIKNNFFVEKTIKRVSPKIFINLAALTNVDYCENNQNLTYKVNTEFPEIVLKKLKSNLNDYYFIQISTDMIYSGKGPHKEEHPKPINEYSKSKYETDKILLGYNAISLRTNFFGKSQNKSRLSFSDQIYKSCLNEKKIHLFRDVQFSPVSFNTINKVLNLIIKRKIFGIYNLGSKKGMSKENFGINLCKTLNLNTNYIKPNYLKKMNSLAKRPFDMRLDISKLEKKLNLKFTNTENEIKSIKSDYL